MQLYTLIIYVIVAQPNLLLDDGNCSSSALGTVRSRTYLDDLVNK